jgi:hypothetical protein
MDALRWNPPGTPDDSTKWTVDEHVIGCLGCQGYAYEMVRLRTAIASQLTRDPLAETDNPINALISLVSDLVALVSRSMHTIGGGVSTARTDGLQTVRLPGDVHVTAESELTALRSAVIGHGSGPVWDRAVMADQQARSAITLLFLELDRIKTGCTCTRYDGLTKECRGDGNVDQTRSRESGPGA